MTSEQFKTAQSRKRTMLTAEDSMPHPKKKGKNAEVGRSYMLLIKIEFINNW